MEVQWWDRSLDPKAERRIEGRLGLDRAHSHGHGESTALELDDDAHERELLEKRCEDHEEYVPQAWQSSKGD